MHITTRNVNTAFRELVRLVKRGGKTNVTYTNYDDDGNPTHTTTIERDLVVKRPSRNGNVLMIDEPITVTYTHPRERVLFNAARDANPFFHLYEALWMLAGRNDVESLSYYNKRMAEFSDDGKTFNGAYGYRWRHDGGMYGEDEIDQLDVLVAHLKTNPDSRRAVLQMWNVDDDLLKIDGREATKGEGDDVSYMGFKNPPSKDVCCNLSVMFSIRECRRSAQGVGVPDAFDRYIDMTVTNRSNDMIWGMLGANYVHFTFLQEYMAARLGVGVGKYHHFTNNLHVYDWNWKPEEWLDEKLWDAEPVYTNGDGSVESIPLVSDPAVFEKELPKFVEQYGNLKDGIMEGPFTEYAEPFLRDVAQPMLDSYLAYRHRGGTTMSHASRVKAEDWRIAARNWLEKRLNKRGDE